MGVNLIQVVITYDKRSTEQVILCCLFDYESQICASNEKEYFITVRLNFRIQPVCIRPSFQ